MTIHLFKIIESPKTVGTSDAKFMIWHEPVNVKETEKRYNFVSGSHLERFYGSYINKKDMGKVIRDIEPYVALEHDDIKEACSILKKVIDDNVRNLNKKIDCERSKIELLNSFIK